LNFDHLSPEGREVVRLYLEGLPYKEIAQRLRVTRQFAYAVVYRQVCKGTLKPRRKPDEVMKRKMMHEMKIGRLGATLNALSTKQLALLFGRIKRGETISEALVRIALSR
jgi:transposase